MGNGYVFFEVLEPDEISYTYKLNPAAFSPPWNESFGGEIKLVPGYPECGCSYLQNHDDIEGQIGKFLYANQRGSGVCTKSSFSFDICVFICS